MYSSSDSFPENSNSSEKKTHTIIVISDKRATDGAKFYIHVGLEVETDGLYSCRTK